MFHPNSNHQNNFLSTHPNNPKSIAHTRKRKITWRTYYSTANRANSPSRITSTSNAVPLMFVCLIVRLRFKYSDVFRSSHDLR